MSVCLSIMQCASASCNVPENHAMCLIVMYTIVSTGLHRGTVTTAQLLPLLAQSPRSFCPKRSRGCQGWKQSSRSSGPRKAGVASVANLECSVDAIPDYFKHQQSGVLLSNQAKSFDCLGTSGGHLLAAVSSPNEPGHEDLASCPYRALLP